MSTPLTKQSIVNKFNDIVRNSRYTKNVANFYNTNYSYNIDRNPTPLGPRSEPAMQTSDITPTGAMGVNIFNILHSFAMEMTRVRQSRPVFLKDERNTTDGMNKSLIGPWSLTALHSRHALYFPIPGGDRSVGEQINSSNLDSFLNSLKTNVNTIRSNSSYGFEIVSCHSSCHSSCHGSRSRR